MDPRKYEYQSDFAKHYVARGRAEGRASIVIRQLGLRFGTLPGRLLTAKTLQEALGS